MSNLLNPELEKYIPVAQAIAKLLHPHAEVVVHDIQSNTVAAIFNGFSRRKAGDESWIAQVESLKRGPEVEGPYPKRMFDGRRLKYVTSLLKDDRDEVVGMMCINLDVSVFEALETTARDFLVTAGDSSQQDQMFDDDWQQRIDAFVRQYLLEKNLNVKDLRRKDRAMLVKALQEAGAFRAKSAATYVARVLDVSRATVYSDLAEAAENASEGSEP
jgi:predicted transcriptional regulator YheO